MAKTAGRQFREAIFEQFARIGKALAHPARLELLDLLTQAERSVEALAQESDLPVASTSQHLQVLRAARLVEADKRGLYVVYRIADPAVEDAVAALRCLAERRLAEVEQVTRLFLEGREGMDPMDRDQLLARVREGEVTVLDVRPKDEYLAGHLPGALSIPLRELEQRLGEVPRDREVVAYCRGPYCALAVRAVEVLREQGFEAVRLRESLHDLRAEGFDVVSRSE